MEARSREHTPVRRSFDQHSDSPHAALRWYWNRLRCMSVAEVGYRAKQKAVAQLQQLGLSTARQVPPPDVSRRSNDFVALDAPVAPAPYTARADRIVSGRLPVFDLEYVYQGVPQWNRDPKTGRVAPFAFGKTLDYRDETLVGDIKYLWEPNRHLHLVALAQAYRLSADDRYSLALHQWLGSWFRQCPYLRGPNWASSLELAIRLINWSIAWQLIGGSDSALFAGGEGARLRDRWLAVIYQHMHFIAGHYSRFSSANNHLIGEAAGLYLAAVTWPCWADTSPWRRQAKAVLVREALQQNAPDGVNREQAVSYQQFVLDFLLFAGLAGRKNRDEFPDVYWQRLEQMLEFVAAIMDVRGHVPMIGDADDGYVTALAPAHDFCPYRSLLATGAALFGRADFKRKAGAFDDKSRWLLGVDGAATFERLPAPGSGIGPRTEFPDGGYYILGSDFDGGEEIRIVADAGPLGYQAIAAHGHADALAFTLSVGGDEFLVDPGTFAYHTEREWRNYFRGTAAHNTVRIDAQDQSVSGGNFMWVQHACVQCRFWESAPERDRFVGWHDGYRRLPDPVGHERELVLDKRRKHLHITDVIECRAAHRVERFWHFAEDVAVQVDERGAICARKSGVTVRLVPHADTAVRARLHRGQATPPRGWVSRRFGVKHPAGTVVWSSEVNGTTRLRALLEIDMTG